MVPMTDRVTLDRGRLAHNEREARTMSADAGAPFLTAFSL